MKTCSTCKHNNPKYPAACTKHNIVLFQHQLHLMKCDYYEEKPKPLRLECECEFFKSPSGLVYPSSDKESELMFHEFVGKKLKMTLEEIT